VGNGAKKGGKKKKKKKEKWSETPDRGEITKKTRVRGAAMEGIDLKGPWHGRKVKAKKSRTHPKDTKNKLTLELLKTGQDGKRVWTEKGTDG